MINTTRVYFQDGTSFGAQHARPSTDATGDRDWSEDELHAAAHVGSAGRDLHPRLLKALCAHYLDMVEDACAHGAQLAELSAELIGERTRIAGIHAESSSRLAEVVKLHARVSLENLHLRHELAGTTPVSVEIALARARPDTEHRSPP